MRGGGVLFEGCCAVSVSDNAGPPLSKMISSTFASFWSLREQRGHRFVGSIALESAKEGIGARYGWLPVESNCAPKHGSP